MELHLPYAPTPVNVPLLAESCVDAAKKVSGFELDYTPASLALLQEQIERFRAGGVRLENVSATLFCFGCYLGEVLIRNLGGRWVEEETSPMKGLAGWPLVTLMDNGSCWNPIGRVFKRFDEGQSEDIIYLYSTVKSGARPRQT